MRTAALRRFASFLIMVVMLASGICFQDSKSIGDRKADSFFSYIEHQEEIPALVSSAGILSNWAMCTEEQLGLRDTVSRIDQDSRTCDRMGGRTGLLPPTEVLPDKSILKFIMMPAGEYWENLSSTVIISYVHSQDGAKSRRA